MSHFRTEVARCAAKTPLQHEMTRLKAIHRSWMRGSECASNREEWRAAARVVRRWMRPVRRAMRREAR